MLVYKGKVFFKNENGRKLHITSPMHVSFPPPNLPGIGGSWEAVTDWLQPCLFPHKWYYCYRINNWTQSCCININWFHVITPVMLVLMWGIWNIQSAYHFPCQWYSKLCLICIVKTMESKSLKFLFCLSVNAIFLSSYPGMAHLYTVLDDIRCCKHYYQLYYMVLRKFQNSTCLGLKSWSSKEGKYQSREKNSLLYYS